MSNNLEQEIHQLLEQQRGIRKEQLKEEVLLTALKERTKGLNQDLTPEKELFTQRSTLRSEKIEDLKEKLITAREMLNSSKQQEKPNVYTKK